jgi:hypothetical protein
MALTTRHVFQETRGAKRGWEEVPVVVVELDALRRELATLDENIVRHELTELERAEMEARRREIYEMLYPLAKRGVISNVRRSAQFKLSEVESDDVDHTDTVSVWYESNRLNNDEDAEGDVEVKVPPHYTQYAAEHGGESDRTVRRRLRIAEKLHPEVREYIRGTPLADDQRGLLRLTRLEDPELQCFPENGGAKRPQPATINRLTTATAPASRVGQPQPATPVLDGVSAVLYRPSTAPSTAPTATANR